MGLIFNHSTGYFLFIKHTRFKMTGLGLCLVYFRGNNRSVYAVGAH